jgi:hypothetical protein
MLITNNIIIRGRIENLQLLQQILIRKVRLSNSLGFQPDSFSESKLSYSRSLQQLFKKLQLKQTGP